MRQQIDSLLASFELKEATKLLQSLSVKMIPKEQRYEYARLARRANLTDLAIKLLWSSVYEEAKPADTDIIEFASCIRSKGLINQSLVLLSRVGECPEKYLYEAFCHINKWNYKEAAVKLDYYLTFSGITEKQKAVARINQVSCFISMGAYDKALMSLATLEPFCEKDLYHLYLNCLELKGQVYTKCGEYGNASKTLIKAKRLSQNQSSKTTLFIDKWLLITECAQEHIAVDDERVLNFKGVIRQQTHWETLRDFDLQLAYIARNHSQINQVFFGTPYEQFREKMKEQLSDYQFSGSYIWMDGRNLRPIERSVDLYGPSKDLPVGMTLHRMLMCLSADFYRPWSIGRIFDTILPKEIYDPFSSPKRIYSSIEKVKGYIEKTKIDFEFKATDNGYRLRPDKGGCFMVHEKMLFSTRENFALHLMSLSHGYNEWTRETLSERLGLSKFQAQRLVKEFIDQGLVDVVGQGKATKYSLKAKAS